jgi:hypothetical protein
MNILEYCEVCVESRVSAIVAKDAFSSRSCFGSTMSAHYTVRMCLSRSCWTWFR